VISKFEWVGIRLPPGTTIGDAVAAALDFAKREQVLVRLEFNDVPISVAMDGDAEAIVKRYTEKYADRGMVQREL
jgi:hypothetical protein